MEGRFRTTRWSDVLAARTGQSTESRNALAKLCEAYWYPLYVFVRRQGYSAEEACDLTQGYFARLIERGDLRQVDPHRGRFRSFLLASIKHFLSNERDREQAKKAFARTARSSCSTPRRPRGGSASSPRGA